MEKQRETTIVYWGCIGIVEKEMETTIAYWGYMGIMEKKILHYNGRYVGGYMGIMEKKMETITNIIIICKGVI